MLHLVNMLMMVCMVEPILLILAISSYLRFAPSTNSRSFLFYLATQLAISVVFLPVLFEFVSFSGLHSAGLLDVYTPIFWSGAIVSGLFAIATLHDILKQLLAVVPALQRVALIAFQWVMVICSFLILGRVLDKWGRSSLDGVLATLTNGINLTQLVLLLPLLPFTLSVQRKLRSHIQDLMIGLAVLAASSTSISLAYHANGELSSAAAVVAGNLVLIVTLIFWCRCFVTQDKHEVPLVISIDSKLVRLSEQLRIADTKPPNRLR